MNISFIGLGNMGHPMAGHLTQHGHTLTVYNRTTSKAERWVKDYGHQFANTPQAAAEQADLVFTCVGNDNDLRAVILGENGLIHGLKSGAILVDHSTVSAEISRELAMLLAEKGIAFVDAPVSGGQQGAQKGQLSIMCGAYAAVFARI